MNLLNKTYNYKKTRKIFKKQNFLFFFQADNTKFSTWVNIEQQFIKANLNIYKIKNSLFKSSSNINYVPLIYSNTQIGYINKNGKIFDNSIAQIFKHSKNLFFLVIIFKTNIYFSKEIKNISTQLNYNNIKTILLLLNSFKNLHSIYFNNTFTKLKNI